MIFVCFLLLTVVTAMLAVRTVVGEHGNDTDGTTVVVSADSCAHSSSKGIGANVSHTDYRDNVLPVNIRTMMVITRMLMPPRLMVMVIAVNGIGM